MLIAHRTGQRCRKGSMLSASKGQHLLIRHDSGVWVRVCQQHFEPLFNGALAGGGAETSFEALQDDCSRPA
jgi:hypothetical protein